MIKEGDILEGKLSMVMNGSAYLMNDELEKDIYISRKRVNKGLHMDVVKVEITKIKDRGPEGKVIEVLERFKTTFVGTLDVSEKYAFLIADSNKMTKDIFIPLDSIGVAKNGQKVVVEMTEWNDEHKNPRGVVVDVLGEVGDNDTEIHSILHEYGLPYKFEDDIEDEANEIPLLPDEEEIAKRKDMRNVLTFTIDPDTAKDFDDALSVEWVDGKLTVGIHIADVSHYVKPKTNLDDEAYNRGTSVYLVDRVVPMLPERLSNGVCSLRPHEDKLCYSAIFTLDKDGKVEREWFGRTAINSDHRFTYEEAQVIIEGDTEKIFQSFGMDFDPILYNNLIEGVTQLDKVAKKMRKKRGSLEFNGQELKFKLDENGKPTDVIFKIQKDANKLIEEYMLLANRRVTKFLNMKKVPMVNRVHAEPDPDKLSSLKDFILQLGYDIKINSIEEIKSSLNQLLKDVKGTSEENIINNLVVRTMRKAEYSTENIGHYGLGFVDYGHFTSPIRRYPDVMLHRILTKVLENKEPQKETKLIPKCQYLSKKEIVAQKASRDSIKYKQCEFMEDKIGKVYKAVVVSVVKYGLFVEIKETNCEGLIRLSDIDGDTFVVDETNHCVKGFNTGEIIRLGDDVNIVVKSVDIEKKNIDLTLIRL
jgi:ribonuclease R